MQAVILAAGQSSRFYPFHSATHKSLIKIMGKTLLEHTLISLKHAGITDVVLVVSPNSPIEALLSEGKTLGVHITYVIQEETLGMGHALLQTEKHIKDDFFLLHAYHFEVDQFIPDMIKRKKHKEEVVLLGKNLGGTDRYGYVLIEGEKVTGIVEKPKEIIRDSLHLIGIYLLNKHFLTTLQDTPLSHYHFEEALDAYAKSGHVTFLETDKKTITLKYAWDILDMKDYLLSNIKHHISPKAEVSPHAIIMGTVVIEEGAKVFEGACVKGPCYIGKNVVVGTNALVRDKVVAEENAVIGSYMEMKNTVMMQGATSHTGFIGDSVVGSNSKIGAEICTTNVRLDRQTILPEVKENKVSSYRTHLGVIIGDNAIIGARVTTMPGTIIGNDSFIGPSTVVMKNVADNTKYYTEFKNIEKPRK